MSIAWHDGRPSPNNVLDARLKKTMKKVCQCFNQTINNVFQQIRHRLTTTLVRPDYPPTVNEFHTDASGRLRKSNVVVSGA